MELTHSGAKGLAYTLSCDAGAWHLKYTGSVPAGTGEVTGHYQVDISRADGLNLTERRAVALPSPSLLGQALLREAVLLDDGSLALRDCKGFECTVYRPLAGSAGMAQAAVTVTPEVKRLNQESTQLKASLSAAEQELERLRAELAKTISTSETALKSQADQAAADIAGLERAYDEKVAALTREAAEKAVAVQDLQKTAQTQADELAAMKSALTQMEAELQAAKNAVTGQDGQVTALKAELDQANERIKRAEDESFTLSTKLEATVIARDMAKQTASMASSELESAKASLAMLGQEYQKAIDALRAAAGVANETQRALDAEVQARAAQAQELQDKIQALTQEAELAKANLAAERDGYAFAIQDLISQHADQVAKLKQALPDVPLDEVLKELVPTSVKPQQ